MWRGPRRRSWVRMSHTSHPPQESPPSPPSGRLDRGPGRPAAPAAAAAPGPVGEHVEGAALLVVEGQLGGWPEQHGHHAVVARQPPDHAGVAVDSCRHVPSVGVTTDNRRPDGASPACRGPRDGLLGRGSGGSGVLLRDVGPGDQLDRVRAAAPAAGDRSTVSSRTSVSSTRWSPARSKCQNSVVRRARLTSNRVRLPQPPHRQRWVGPGISMLARLTSRRICRAPSRALSVAAT